MMSIGFNIKKLRVEKNFSQSYLAYELKISQSELSKIENNQIKRIDYLFVERLCAFFKKDFNFFIRDNSKLKSKELTDIYISDRNIYESGDFLLFEIQKIILDNKKKEEIINNLKEENQKLKEVLGVN